MAKGSGIEWICEFDKDGKVVATGTTINTVIGCEEISPGCANCWAKELTATRMAKNRGLPMYHDLAYVSESGRSKWTGVIKCLPERLPLLARASGRVFVNDMSDMFHEKVPFEFVAANFGAMASNMKPNGGGALFYVLTKRAERMEDDVLRIGVALSGRFSLPALAEHAGAIVDKMAGEGHGDIFYKAANRLKGRHGWPLQHVVLGVTVDDRKHGLPRLEALRRLKAKGWRTFASVEPLLEDLGNVDFAGVDLVIVGGEATPNRDHSRQFDLAWARRVFDAAKRAGSKRFFKQAGDHVIDTDRGRSLGAPEQSRLLTLGKKGHDLERLPPDLRIRENLPMVSP